MNDTEYLVLMGRGDLRPLRPQFQKLGGFYTGFCWAFPAQSESILSSIISCLPNYGIQRMPLADGQTFESHRQTYKGRFFKKKLKDLDNKITQAMNDFSLTEFSNDSIEVLEVSKEVRDHFFEMLYQKECLKESIAHAEGMEKVLKEQKSPDISIKFICEQDVNYLQNEAPDMPRLVNFLEDGQAKPFIPKGIVAQLVGAGGVGKTHALAQLALSIAIGSNWLGIYPIEKPGYVFMCLGENKDPDIHRLLRKIVKGQMNSPEATLFSADPLQKAAKRISVMSCTGRDATFIQHGLPTSFFNELFQVLKDAEPEDGWSLLIFDPISRFLGADAETDNAAATQVISLLERMTLQLKGSPSLIFGHHMNKSGVSSTNTDQGAARGSSAITDGVRWQANLERVIKKGDKSGEAVFELNQVTLRVVKSNFTAILPAQKLIKDQNGCLKAETGNAPRVVSPKKQAMDRKWKSSPRT